MNAEFRNYIYGLMTDRKSGKIASAVKFLLFLLSLLYSFGIKLSHILREEGILRTARLEVKLISVGNLTMGGTGKTPFVEYLARFLSDRGNKVVILTRGYRLAVSGDDKAPAAVKKPYLFEEIGDEPALLKRNLPQVSVIVGADRVKSGRAAIEKQGADILLLDDGFQHWALSRDVDIVMIDSVNPFGNGCCLPRGILREPVSSLLRADIVVLSKADAVSKEQIGELKKRVRAVNPNALLVCSAHKPHRLRQLPSGSDTGLAWLGGKEVCAMAGIGDPEYFKKTLEGLGASVKAAAYFQDHQPYSYKDVESAAKSCAAAGVDTIIMTEKDGIKLRPVLERHSAGVESFQLKFFELAVRAVITEGEDKFVERLRLPGLNRNEKI